MKALSTLIYLLGCGLVVANAPAPFTPEAYLACGLVLMAAGAYGRACESDKSK